MRAVARLRRGHSNDSGCLSRGSSLTVPNRRALVTSGKSAGQALFHTLSRLLVIPGRADAKAFVFRESPQMQPTGLDHTGFSNNQTEQHGTAQTLRKRPSALPTGGRFRFQLRHSGLRQTYTPQRRLNQSKSELGRRVCVVKHFEVGTDLVPRPLKRHLVLGRSNHAALRCSQFGTPPPGLSTKQFEIEQLQERDDEQDEKRVFEEPKFKFLERVGHGLLH